jgi:hypothetical protein
MNFVARVVFLIATTALGATATASTWNSFRRAYNSDIALYFFDADTVVKQGETVTLWIKHVRTKTSDADGSWQSSMREIVNCPKRTAQILSYSIYNKDGSFIRSVNLAGAASDIAPDSILEQIHKAVCSADFPRSQSRDLYFPVENNDPATYTRIFVEYLEGQKDLAPK